jgi:hypothetical protein
MFTDEKYQLCQRVLDSYRNSTPWPVETAHLEVAYALLERIQWRPKDEELLRKAAATIRNKGLRAARLNH